MDDHELVGMDPHDILAREAARLDAHFAALVEAGDDDEWARPSRCEGWDVRDVLAHLDATEEYHRACLDGTVSALMASMGEKGATDLDSANAIGIAERSGLAPAVLLDDWRARNAVDRADLRARGDGDVDSSVGAYPARWQAWHLAAELATHADDAWVPETEEEAPARRAWRATFGRAELSETRPDVTTTPTVGGTRVRGEGVDAVVDDVTFVEAVAHRLTADSPIPTEVRDLLGG